MGVDESSVASQDLLPKSAITWTGLSMMDIKELSPANMMHRKNKIAKTLPPWILPYRRGILRRVKDKNWNPEESIIGNLPAKDWLNLLSLQKHPLFHCTNLPYEGEPRIPRTIEAQCSEDFTASLSLLCLHGEDCGEDQDSAHEADHIVAERCYGAQPNRSLRALHEGGIGEKRSRTSAWHMHKNTYKLNHASLYRLPVSQAF